VLSINQNDRWIKTHIEMGIRDLDEYLKYRTMAIWLCKHSVAHLRLAAAKFTATDRRGAVEAFKRVTSIEAF